MTSAPDQHAAAPPHDLAAERAVLAAMMANPDTIGELTQKLTAADFYRPAHATIFQAVTALFSDGYPTDHLAVISYLIEAGDIGRVGGATYLTGLVADAPPGAPAWFANAVLDRAEDRRWLEHAEQTRQFVLAPGTTAERRGQIEASFDRVVRQRDTGRGKWAGDILGPAIDQMAAAFDGHASARIVPTGFRDLDRLLGGGLHAGQLVVVAGRPGLGKSTIGSDFVRHASLRHGMTSMFVTLEMSDVELLLRWISAETRIPLHLVRSGSLREEEWEKVTQLIDRFVENRIMVYDDPGMYLPQIRAEARRMKRRHDLRLLVVDYLQLMSNPGRKESRQQEVSDLSRGLKLLAKEIECPVVAMSQLNRNPETRADKRPGLGDLRESGSIEQDADVVILLHWDQSGDSARTGEVDFIVAKQRNGPTGTVTVANQLHISRFHDMAVA